MIIIMMIVNRCAWEVVQLYVRNPVLHDVGALASSVVSRLVARHVMKILIGLVNGIILKSLVL